MRSLTSAMDFPNADRRASGVSLAHDWWMVKRDLSEPALYAVILAALLDYRVAAKIRERSVRAGVRSAAALGTAIKPARTEQAS